MPYVVRIIAHEKLAIVREIVDADVAARHLNHGVSAYEAHVQLLKELGREVEFGKTPSGAAFAWSVDVSELKPAVQIQSNIAALKESLHETYHGLVEKLSECLTLGMVASAWMRTDVFHSLEIAGAANELDALTAMACLAIDPQADLFVSEPTIVPQELLRKHFDISQVRYGVRSSLLALDMLQLMYRAIGSSCTAASSMIEENPTKCQNILAIAKTLCRKSEVIESVLTQTQRFLQSADPTFLDRVTGARTDLERCHEYHNRVVSELEKLRQLVGIN